MNYVKLKKHIIALATLPETKSPVISVYLDMKDPYGRQRADLMAWSQVVRHSFHGAARRDFDEAFEEVVSFVDERPACRSVAIFSRWGEYPMFLPLRFNVPMETSFHVGGLPLIHPLVELKDRFNRFVLVMTNSEAARIYEISLGQVSESLMASRPEIRERLGREWTREHYHNHRRHRDHLFVKEKVEIIERLMSKRGHNTLLLAGEPRFIARLREALPHRLRMRIGGEIGVGVRDTHIPEVIDLAIRSFLDQEERESHDAVRLLHEAVRRGGLGVVGMDQTLRVLQAGQVDLLILSRDLPGEDREKLVRLAARHDTRIETVGDNDLLERNGGVGCLLRYLPPTDVAKPMRRPA